MSVVRNTGAALISRIGNTACTVAAGMIVARSLGPDGNGQYALVVLFHTVLVTVAGLGLPIAHSYLTGKGRYTVSTLAGNAIVASLTIGVVVGAAAVPVLILLKPTFFTAVPWPELKIALIVAPLTLITQNLGGVLLGAGRVQLLSGLGVIASGLLCAGLIGFTIAGALTVHTAVASWAVSSGVAAMVSIVAVHSIAPISMRPQPRLLYDALCFGAPAYLTNIVGVLNFRLDVFLVGAFVGARAVGYYAAAVLVAEVSWYGASALATALYSRVTSSSPADAFAVTARALRHGVVVTAASTIGIAAALPLVFWVLGPQYGPSHQILIILLPGMFAYALAPIWSAYFTGQLGRPILSFYVAGCSLVADTVLNLLLLPRWGVVGAAWASTAAYVLAAAVALQLFRHVTGIGWADGLRVRRDDLLYYRDMLRRALVSRPAQ